MDGFQGFKATEGCPNVYSYPSRIGLGNGQVGVLHCLLTCGQGKLHKAVGAAEVAFVEILLGSKVPCFPCNPYLEVGGVEPGDWTNTRHAVTDLLPDRLNTCPMWRNGPKPRNNHPSIHASPPLYMVGRLVCRQPPVPDSASACKTLTWSPEDASIRTARRMMIAAERKEKYAPTVNARTCRTMPAAGESGGPAPRCTGGYCSC